MSSENETPSAAEAVADFMKSPLVQWVKTFKKSKEEVDFDELTDSVFLLDVLLTIDGGSYNELSAAIDRSASLNRDAKLGNWMLLIAALHRYYSECLQQLVVMPWPDILIMTTETDRGGCVREMEKCIVLILGYAVQCERKEDYVGIITALDLETQRDLITHIQQVTEDPRNVISVGEGSNQRDPDVLIQVVQTLSHQRLQALEKLVAVLKRGNDDVLKNDQICDDKAKSRRRPFSSLESCAPTGSPQESRQQGRNLNSDNICSCQMCPCGEEKTRLLAEMRERLATAEGELAKTRSENVILAAEANAARMYKDELDAVKEMAIQAEKQKKEIEKYKNTLSDVDFYRNKFEETKTDNELLMEARTRLERQLSSCNSRIEKLANDLVLSQIQLDSSKAEQSNLSRKVVELTDDNARLEFEKSQMKAASLLSSSTLSRFMSITSIDCLPATDIIHQRDGNSISDEVNETLTTHLMRMQIENDELTLKLREAVDRCQDLERDLGQVRREGDAQVQTKVEAVQRQLSEQQLKNSKRLSKDFEEKITEIEERAADMKQKMTQEFKRTLSEKERQSDGLRQHIDELQKQISFIEDSWKRDKDTCARLHSENRYNSTGKTQVTHESSLIRDSSRHGSADKEQLKQRNSIVHDNNNSSSSNQDKLKVEQPDKSAFDLKKIDEHCNDDDDEDAESVRSTAAASDTSRVRSRDISVDLNASTHSRLSTASNTLERSTLPSRSGTHDKRPGPTGKEAAEDKETKRQTSAEGQGCSTPIRGVVAPIIRSTESPRKPMDGDPPANLNRPAGTGIAKLPPEFMRDRLAPNFSRNDKYRHSMPVRTSSVPHPHTSRGSSSSKYWLIGGQKVHQPDISYSHNRRDTDSLSSSRSSRDFDAIQREHLTGSPASEAMSLDRRRHRRPERDSKTSDDGRDSFLQFSFREKTVTQTTTESISGDEESRCRALVDQLMRLQHHSQQLMTSNTDLKQRIKMIEGVASKLNSLEDRNNQLETENKKLQKIIEALNGTVPQSLYDKRTYQFNTSV